jgi:hypothetical protein
VAGEDLRIEDGDLDAPREPQRRPWVAAVLVAVTLTPVAIGALSLVGDSWFPLGDAASMLFRTSQVGSRDTPLVGTYAVKGWAHPGPFLFYAAAPLYRLTSGDPRSLEWTAAIVNAVTIAAIGAVAWRRGRLPLTVAVMTLVALLIHGLGPGQVVDLWNPYLGLFPFLLVVLLAWDAALGRPGSVLLAAFPAAVAAQCHVAFVPLIGVAALWLACWCRWWGRIMPGDGLSSGGLVDLEMPRPPWHRWRRATVLGAGLAALVSLPPLLDLVFDTHNLASAAAHLAAGAGEQIGPVHGLGLVSRYTRPDGPWMGGTEPVALDGAQGSGPVVVILVLALLGGCVHVARRRGLPDVAALATLTAALVVAAIPAASNLVVPLFLYLTQWLKIIGGLVWFTVAWTGWRLVQPHLRRLPVRRIAGVAACIGLVAATAWSWGDATRIEPDAEFERAVVQDLRAQINDRLPRDVTYRVDGVADLFGQNVAGVIYYMIEDGYDVLTSDGAPGLKWGHVHRWGAGDHYDVRLTIAVHYGGSWRDTVRECLADPRVEPVLGYDELDPADRARLDALKLATLTAPETVSAADRAEARRLERDGFRIGVFEGDTGCARQQPSRPANG